MPDALIIENIPKDAERICALLAAEKLTALVCQDGAQVEKALQLKGTFALAFLSVDITGPLFGMELIVRCRKAWPAMAIVVVSGSLDAGLAVRAAILGATDFIERPIDDRRVTSCIRAVAVEPDPSLPLVDDIRAALLGEHREQLIGESPSFIDALRQLAKVIPHDDSKVLILGESGTGKELFARAIHQLGPRSRRPWVTVNIGEIPSTLVESHLFGHERGAFTDAREQRIGLLELASDGSLFLDEIGDLEASVQSKLLRAIQEREFRRLGGNSTLKFKARLISATNLDMTKAIQQGTFRRDLYHRIGQVVINVPPLRERKDDIDLLLDHFLRAYAKGEQHPRLAKETRTILRSYTFPGNVRELQNLVQMGLIQSSGSLILPRHLPLENMGGSPADAAAASDPVWASLEDLFASLNETLPNGWQGLTYREASKAFRRGFDRVYLPRLLDLSRHNITKAAAAASMDTKTFRKHWNECGLSPLAGDEERSE